MQEVKFRSVYLAGSRPRCLRVYPDDAQSAASDPGEGGDDADHHGQDPHTGPRVHRLDHQRADATLPGDRSAAQAIQTGPRHPLPADQGNGGPGGFLVIS